MNIGGIQFPCFLPYGKPTYEIYVSGCDHSCDDCHNPELQDFNYGYQWSKSNILVMKEREHLFEVISIMGGDLLCQPIGDSVQFMVSLTNEFPNKEFWLFTGKEPNEIKNWVWSYFDYIKVEKYNKELKQDGFPSSSNQRVLSKGKDY